MFIRLVIAGYDPDSRQQQGVFQAAYELIRSGTLEQAEVDALREVLRWFNENLAWPDDCPPRAIFWFKSSAPEMIRKVWELAQLLRAHDLLVDVVKTERPGYVVYEDAYQVAAIPFRNTF